MATGTSTGTSTGTLTSADRVARASEQVATAQQQAKQVEQEIANSQRQLQLLTLIEAGEQRSVDEARKRAVATAAALVEARSEHSIVAGSGDEAAAKAVLDAATSAHDQALVNLGNMVARLQAAQDNTAAETPALNAAIEASQKKLAEIQSQMKSLNQKHSQAAGRAKQEAADNAAREILTAYVAFWDAVQKHHAAVGKYASILPRTLLPVELTRVIGNQPLDQLFHIFSGIASHDKIWQISRYARNMLAGMTPVTKDS